MAEVVKKPVGGAFGAFQNDRRDTFKKEALAAGDKSFGATAKLASAAWKVMDDAGKAVYEKQYQEAFTKFKEFQASDAYVAPEKKARKGKDGQNKPAKDKDAPKKPVGGAYGIFQNEKRAEFTQQAAAAGDKSFGGGAKLAAAAYAAMTATTKATYEEKYKAAKRKYDLDLAAYMSDQAELAPSASTGKNPAKADSSPSASTKKSLAKRKADELPAPPKKVAKTDASNGAGEKSVHLDAAVLKEAAGRGMKSALENLAGQKGIVAKGIDGAKLLRSLKAAGGQMKKAKAALMGA